MCLNTIAVLFLCEVWHEMKKSGPLPLHPSAISSLYCHRLTHVSIASVLTRAVYCLCMCLSLQLDNAAFAVGLPEHTRTRVETVGRVELEATDIQVITRSKLMHMALIVIFIFVWLMRASYGGMGLFSQLGIQFLPFLFGGICDALWLPEAITPDKIKGVSAAICLTLAGYVVYTALCIITTQ